MSYRVTQQGKLLEVQTFDEELQNVVLVRFDPVSDLLYRVDVPLSHLERLLLLEGRWYTRRLSHIHSFLLLLGWVVFRGDRSFIKFLRV